MKVVVSFSLESEVCAGIDQIAAREGHTRSRAAEHLLRAGLAARQQQAAPIPGMTAPDTERVA